MLKLFWAITMVNLATLIAAGGLGYWHVAGTLPAAAGGAHILAGALASIVCIGVHCIVFTYFIATAKWAQHAVSVKKLEAAILAPTRSFKAQAFPAALASMAAVFATLVLGVLLDAGYSLPRAVHHAAAWLAFGVNLAAAAVEHRAIARNGRLIDRILELINTRQN